MFYRDPTRPKLHKVYRMSGSLLSVTCEHDKQHCTFANSLDPDQDRQNVGPDLDSNCLTLWWYSWKIFFKKLILKKKIIRRQMLALLPSRQRVIVTRTLLSNTKSFYFQLSALLPWWWRRVDSSGILVSSVESSSSINRSSGVSSIALTPTKIKIMEL